MTNAANWFEIPVKDFDRAKKFYTTVLETSIKDAHMEDMKYGILPHDMENNGVGGAIVEAKGGQEPSANGTTVYLNGGNDLNIALSRVEEAGGRILMPKTSVGEEGFIAHFIDTEGNKVALHSMN